MKNHQYVNGKLLQTNKKFADLKESQKSKIVEWLYEEYKSRASVYEKTSQASDNEIIEIVMSKIYDADIWIPAGEVIAYYLSKKSHFAKRLEKELLK